MLRIRCAISPDYAIFKRYIERNVVERRLLWIQLLSLVVKKHGIRCFKQG